MADTTKQQFDNDQIGHESSLDKAQLVWQKNRKSILIVLGALVVLFGGYFGYKQFFLKPKEEEAAEKSFKAEEYYRMDSVSKALNGDGVNPGFVSIAGKYSGTKAGNLANFYAGVCYVKLNQNDKAVQYLKKFSSDAPQIQQRAYLLLGDAYGDLGKNKEALDYYKKAASHFEADQQACSEALFRAAFLAQQVLNNKTEAIALYKELKQKFPGTQHGFEADKYLAQLGVYKID
ncbi:tetratricopeptide repeat protein [Niabella terrae]